MSLFKITPPNGFHITFANDVTVSVQWNYANYCDNYDNREANDQPIPSTTAEVAVFRGESWVLPDDVEPRVTPEDVARLLAYTSTWDPATPFVFEFTKGGDS